MRLNGYIGYATCENDDCSKNFWSTKPVYRHVNADADGTVIEDFENYNFNRVKCKYCKTEFTYEMPLVVYNLKKGYFVFTGQNIIRDDRLPRLFEILGVENFKIYHVPYYAFAVEVVNVYKYNLDYDTICDIKNKELNASKLDIKREYIIFNRFENDTLYYHHLNYLNVIEKTYEIKYEIEGAHNK